MNSKDNFCCNCNTVKYISEYRRILGSMIQGMTGARLTDSISHNFIAQMIPHHRAAIEMSRNLLKFTENKALIDIANGIINEQTQSIKNMRNVKCSCSRKKNSCCNVREYQRQVSRILKIMFDEMNNAYTDNCINCNFMREMIPHHMGAVKMSKNALGFEICPELKPILEAIISSQEKGIGEMEKLLKSLSCK